MLDPIVVRSQEELATIVEALIRGVNDGRAAAQAAGVFTLPPEKITVQGVYLVEANVDTVEETQATPEITETQTQVTPERISTRAETQTQTTAETATPSGRTVLVQNAGEDGETVEREYEEIT